LREKIALVLLFLSIVIVSCMYFLLIGFRARLILPR